MRNKTIVLAILLLLVVTSTALGHSWYPFECCSDKDCHPIPCSEFISVDPGVVKYLGWEIPKTRIKASMDELCHICINASGAVQCVFFPGTT